MSITLLYGCCQIETCARDLDAVRVFLVDVLGGGPIEQELAEQIAELISGDAYDVAHFDCGEAVFQVNRPSPEMTFGGRKSVHQTYLETRGPTVTNLNFYVDDHAHARELLTSMGAATHIEGPSTVARALADYGPQNTREGAEERPFLFMGARHLIGFDLEIMEPNFRRITEQSVQYPAFVHPRPRTGDGKLLLERLHVIVEDLQETYENLTKLFAPASRSKPYALGHDDRAKTFRIGLGGIEIAYWQPLSNTSELGGRLTELGPGVVAIEFSALDVDPVLARCASAGFAVEPGGQLIGPDGSHLVRSREVAGFDTVLAPRRALAL